MSDLRDAARQALEVLESGLLVSHHAQVLINLRAALEQTVQEPLSDEELDRLWREPMSADWEHREFARAVEAAHGIKENT
jgi:Tfp pilus assembly ATPase PilU